MSSPVWNYSFTVPCALLMVTLVAFYFSRRRLPIRVNRSFLVLMALQLATMIADVASSVADEHYQELPLEAVYALNILFFVLFVARMLSFFLFTVTILDIYDRRIILPASLPYVFTEILALSSGATGAIFYVDGAGYHSGPLYFVLYLCFYFYIALSVILLFVNAKRVSRGVLVSGVAFNLVLLAGNVVRYLFPFLLAMNTFCMIAILIIYLAYMNPDLYLTEDRRAFNMYGFQTVLKDWGGRREYQMLGIVLRNFNYERGIMGSDQTDQTVTAISGYLSKTFPDALPFYIRNGRFALILSSSTDWSEVQQTIAERFSQPWLVEGGSVTLDAVFAHASSKASSGNADRVFSSLLVALDEAKDASVAVFGGGSGEQEGISLVDQRIDALQLLEEALAQGKVEVFLQPLVDSATGEMVAAEALARLRDAGGGLVSPELFIPVAERSGHIGDLDDQVLEKVCNFVKSHDLVLLGLRWVNVNLSPIQCLQPDIAAHLAEEIARYEISPDVIHLEITEESMVDHVQLEKQMQALQQAGFQFALDDYGSGYSNLTRVKRYPFFNIKIDKEVVWDYCKELDSLLPSIVGSFHEMGLTVTAEGVETEEMARSLTAIGCDYLQGFLYSKPLPMDEFVERYG